MGVPPRRPVGVPSCRSVHPCIPGVPTGINVVEPLQRELICFSFLLPPSSHAADANCQEHHHPCTDGDYHNNWDGNEENVDMEGMVYLWEEAVRGGEVGQPGCKGKCWLQHYLHTYVLYIPIVSGTVMVGIMDGAPLVDGGEAVCVGVWTCVFVLFGVLDGVPLVGGDAICVGVWPCGFSSLMCMPQRRGAPVTRIGSERFHWMVKSLGLTKGK